MIASQKGQLGMVQSLFLSEQVQKMPNIDSGALNFQIANIIVKENGNVLHSINQSRVATSSGILIVQPEHSSINLVSQISLWNLYYKFAEARSLPDELQMRIISKDKSKEILIHFSSELDFLLFELSIKKACVVVEPNFNNYFKFDKHLGKGSQASIDLYKDTTNKQYAVKCYELSNTHLQNGVDELVYREIEFLQEFNFCENIIHLEAVYRPRKNQIYLVTKFAKCGTLTTFVKSKKTIAEDQVRSMLEQLLLTVDLMHRQGIVHRDIKPDNILILKDQELKVCLADLGMACRLEDKEEIKLKCGSPGYVDPEVLNNNSFKEQSDIFSLGVVLYNMITYKQLFPGKTVTQIYNSNKIGDCMSQIEKNCNHTTQECRDLLKLMLCRNQVLRPNAEQCLKHPWFSQNKESLEHIIRFNIHTSNSKHQPPHSPHNFKEQPGQSFLQAPNYFQNLQSIYSMNSSQLPNTPYQRNASVSNSKLSYIQLLKDFSSCNFTRTPDRTSPRFINHDNLDIQRQDQGYQIEDSSFEPDQQKKNAVQDRIRKFTFARQDSLVQQTHQDDEEFEEYQGLEEQIHWIYLKRSSIDQIITSDKSLQIKNVRISNKQ